MSRALDPNVSNVQVDALALAHNGTVWEAEFRTRRFPRLTGVAASDIPTVQVRFEFGLLDDKPVIHGVMRGEVELICQRCMQRMQQPIDEGFDLMLVNSEAQFDSVPETHEPWLMESALIEVTDLVEEQLLLALPLIAKHEDEAECITVAPDMMLEEASLQEAPNEDSEDEAQKTQRPFANLRDLMRK